LVQIIREELTRCPPGDIRAGPDRYALIAAWQNGHQRAFSALLQEDPYFWMERSRLAQVQLIYTDDFKMPLMVEDLDPLEFMIEEGHADFAAHVVNARHVYDRNMVRRALEDERRALGGLLLRKSEVDCTYYNDLLNLAAFEGFEEIMDYILQSPDFPSGDSVELEQAMFNAIGGGQSHAVRRLLRAGAMANADDGYTTTLVEACNLASGEIATILIESGADINRPNDQGETPLSRACQNQLEDVVSLLLARGCEVNAMDDSGNSPLHHAVIAIANPIVRLLLNAGADVNCEDFDGVTALLAASEPEFEGATKMTVEMLVTAGASLNHQDSCGNTALLRAAASGSWEIVKLLIGAGADVKIHNYDGGTAFSLYRMNFLTDRHTSSSIEAQERHLSVVKLFLGQGADPDCQYSEGWTPLTLAVFEGHDLVVELLLDHGANMNRPDSEGWTPLTLAASKGDDSVVELLLDHGADEDGKDSDGRTPLTWAAEHGRTTTVQLLLDHGADTNGQDNDGWTPLMMAASEGYYPVVKLLLDYGADMNARDEDGATPLSRAEENENATVVELLLASGAQRYA
jgi:ankyrin repeat protein